MMLIKKKNLKVKKVVAVNARAHQIKITYQMFIENLNLSLMTMTVLIMELTMILIAKRMKVLSKITIVLI